MPLADACLDALPDAGRGVAFGGRGAALGEGAGLGGGAAALEGGGAALGVGGGVSVEADEAADEGSPLQLPSTPSSPGMDVSSDDGDDDQGVAVDGLLGM
jgi:hypothetical protein